MTRPILLTLLALLIALLLSVAVGSVSIPPADLLRVLAAGFAVPADLQTAARIILLVRLPRTALILLTGMALGGSGAAYQGLFRNPLADPYLIGVASGAGLGAVIAMTLDWPYTALGLVAVPAAAFLAALLTVFLVFAVARVGRTVPTTNLILAGMAFSSFATALTSFLMQRATGDLRGALGFILGGVTQTGWKAVLGMLPFVIVGLAGLLLSGHALNLLQFGDEQAGQLGLPVGRARALTLAAASLATAAAVASAGIIGFIGLIVPHLMRLWWGGDYRRLVPLSILGGAVTLLLADTLARVVMAPQELPVGVVTALAGVPFFLWVLRRAKNQGYW